MTAKKGRPPKSLAAGRPPAARKAKSISRKLTRALINSHHSLEKRRLQAAQRNDREREAALAAEISALGGLEEYQRASLQGQRSDRGGDSSNVLLDWLKRRLPRTSAQDDEKLRMLEVGALSTNNACSRSGFFDMVRIDLRSQEPGIQEQDFMERRLPEDDSQRFDVISLSLVLNFVPSPAGRGEMLRRAAIFLRSGPVSSSSSTDGYLPALFIVLPRPCLSNSRYFSAERFDELMFTLGYTKVEERFAQKLAYSLWRRERSPPEARAVFPKRAICPGANRNNFCIVLEEPT